MSTNPLKEILHPKSIAVVGASDKPRSIGYSYIRHLVDYGYRGSIYPVNPKYSEILGFKVYPSIEMIPEHVDYVISAVPAPEVLGMLDECFQKRVKVVHLFTARLSETGRQAAIKLEQKILKRARQYDIRIIGPNCMGVYYPEFGLSFAYDLPKETGSVGLAAQTGGGSAIFINIASMRGVRFSKVISYGNALDLNESDYLDYLTQDPQTKIILMYVEGVKDGRRFFSTLKKAASIKPVIILKGGRGISGSRAVASHTASLAGTMKLWNTMVNQAGAISATSLDEMVDLAVSFYFFPPSLGSRVGIIGGGGGPSVLSADECEEAGLNVIPLPTVIREELRSKGRPIWDWIGNPTDMSILGGSGFRANEMLRLMANDSNFDLLICNISEVPFSIEEGTSKMFHNQVESYIEVKKTTEKPLLAIIRDKSLGINDYYHWRWKLTGELRTKLIEAQIPFYPTVERAAKAVNKVINYYQ